MISMSGIAVFTIVALTGAGVGLFVGGSAALLERPRCPVVGFGSIVGGGFCLGLVFLMVI